MVKIVTLAFNRSDFIELQLNSIKKWVKDFDYTIYDNCPDDAVKNECERLGVKCIPIKLFSEDPSWCVGLSLNKMWETLQHNKGELWYIDHDMFLVNELPNLDCDMAFVPQVRGEYTYPWTGLMYFNMDTLPHPEELKWQVDYTLKDTDVGGLNYHYLQDFNPIVTELEMWTLIDKEKYSFNGKDKEQPTTWLEGEMQRFAERFNFPQPYSFDFLKLPGKSASFIFHYKSASNYPPFYTVDYNKLKTKALCKLLMW